MTQPNQHGTQRERVLYTLMNSEKVRCYDFVKLKPAILNYHARIDELRNEGWIIPNTSYREKKGTQIVRKSFYILEKKNQGN